MPFILHIFLLKQKRLHQIRKYIVQIACGKIFAAAILYIREYNDVIEVFARVFFLLVLLVFYIYYWRRSGGGDCAVHTYMVEPSRRIVASSSRRRRF